MSKAKQKVPVKKANTCPIQDALNAHEKAEQALSKMLAKEGARCAKIFAALKKKKAKLAEAKVKLLGRKKAFAAKAKAKPTAANMQQLKKLNDSIAVAAKVLTEVNDELKAATHGHASMSKLLKHRAAEAKLIAKYRKEQEAIAMKKAKAKSKPKSKKVVKKVKDKAMPGKAAMDKQKTKRDKKG
jgi:nitrogenase molybdenum-iron protein alpha/beta subunit